MSAGQCHTSPVSGIAGEIYTAWTGASDSGLSDAVTAESSPQRDMVASQVEAIATAIDTHAGGGGLTPSVTTTGAETVVLASYPLAANGVLFLQTYIAIRRTDAGGAGQTAMALLQHFWKRIGSAAPAYDAGATGIGYNSTASFYFADAAWAFDIAGSITTAANGNTVELRVLGLTGKTFDWASGLFSLAYY